MDTSEEISPSVQGLPVPTVFLRCTLVNFQPFESLLVNYPPNLLASYNTNLIEDGCY